MLGDKLSKLIATILVAAIATTIVMPRSEGQSAAKAIKGLFDTATNASRSTLGIRK